MPQKQNTKKEGWLKRAFRRYLVDAMSAMGVGLLASVVIGVILSQLAKINILVWLKPYAEMIAASSPVVGSAVGVAIAHKLNVKPLVVFASAVSGAIGYKLGGPVGAYIATIVGAECGNLIRTPIDIILVPIVTIVTGGLTGTFVGPGVDAAMRGLGAFINQATYLQPIPMGFILSTVMGLALAGPISSAALSISLGLNGLAAGAAAVGCATQMVGFAVASYRENKLGGLVAQGLGTAKLQLGNIILKPVIVLPTLLASAILGPLSAAVFGMTNDAIGAGMGTCCLVGQLGAWTSMSQTMPVATVVGLILLMHFILPAVLTLFFGELLRKKGWIRFGDMKLEL